MSAERRAECLSPERDWRTCFVAALGVFNSLSMSSSSWRVGRYSLATPRRALSMDHLQRQIVDEPFDGEWQWCGSSPTPRLPGNSSFVARGRRSRRHMQDAQERAHQGGPHFLADLRRRPSMACIVITIPTRRPRCRSPARRRPSSTTRPWGAWCSSSTSLMSASSNSASNRA